MRKVILLIVTILVANGSLASNDMQVWGTKIKVFTQSEKESDAHFIETEKPIYPQGGNGGHPWCGVNGGNRLFIEFTDKALYSAALAAATSKQPVNLIYSDEYNHGLNHGERNMHVHGPVRCKLLSIWQAE